MKHIDANGKEIKAGDIVDMHQTINGQNLFLIINKEPLDIRYAYNINRKYEYSPNLLLLGSIFDGTVEWEIIGLKYIKNRL